MEYYNNILCVEASELIKAGVMTKSYYDKLNMRKQINVVRRACLNTPALVAVDSLPQRYRDKMVELIGNPNDIAPRKTFEDKIYPDNAAMEFFTSFRLQDGRPLPEDKITEYCANASFLNALCTVYSDKKAKSGITGSKTRNFWEAATTTISRLKSKWGHTLPENPVRLKEKCQLYQRQGYTSLVSRKFGNDNSRKVTDLVERMILSLYTMKEKPYSSTVHEMYLQFMGGAFDVADAITGEIFDRSDFYDQKGTPILISESTVWNYINDPKNRAIVDKVRTGSLEYSSVRRPHHIRHAPQYSFSKISMDDRDLPRKLSDGSRVKAYYAYDVASRCVVGRSYSRKKTTSLFVDCMRDMFQFIEKFHAGMPMEVEVEHHLVNQFADDMMRAGVLFPFVRWCNPGNSQEKRAEHFNKAKKYGFEKRYQDGIGRFYAKLEANRPKYDKIFDEDNDNYKEKHYSFEKLVADDLDIIQKYNNSLHPNQKKYKDKTRLDVLLENMNPNMAKIDSVMLARYVGEKTTTSVRRSMYVQVNYNKYKLSSPNKLESLNPNNYNVDAYYMPVGDSDVKVVHIFQESVYIDSCEIIKSYNEATCEQTDEDREAYTQQAKYVSQFDKMVKDGKNELAKPYIIPAEPILSQVAVFTPSPIEEPVEKEFSMDDFDINAYRKMAQRGL